MPPACGRERWYAVPKGGKRFEEETVAFCYPLSAVRFPREGVRLSDFRLAWYLEMYSLLTASHIKVGDFSTPLRCARNDVGD